MVNLIYS